MAKLPARDYKKTHSRGLKVRGAREFAYGALTGVVLAGVAFAHLHRRAHKSTALADHPRPEPHRAARADNDVNGPGSGKASEKYDFYEMLPNFEVVVPEKDKDVKRDL